MDAATTQAQLAALDAGTGFLDLAGWRRAQVSGFDAQAWLDDLVTAGVRRLAEGASARSLLLTPTGRIRADFCVLRDAGAFVLLQPPGQPGAIDELLAPYVLSSDVLIEEPGSDPPPHLRPSGSGDWVVAVARPAGAVSVADDVFELWRVRHGLARFPIDVDEDSLPAEAGLERFIDLQKGCFLGQESVAKVRNLGHPPRVVLALRAAAPVRAGEEVHAAGTPVGVVSSAVPDGTRTALLARVRWDARAEPLVTASGAVLEPV